MNLDLPNKVKKELFEKYPSLQSNIENQDVARNEYPFYSSKYYSEIVNLLTKYMESMEKDTYNYRSFKKTVSEIEETLEIGDKKLKNKAKSLMDLYSKYLIFFNRNLNNNCFVYREVNGFMQPYILREIGYYGKDSHNDRSYIKLKLAVNSIVQSSITVSIDTDDMKSGAKNYLTVLENVNIHMEKPKYLKEYKKFEKQHISKSKMVSKQMISEDGTKFINDDEFYRENPNSEDFKSNDRYGWNNSNDYKFHNFLSSNFDKTGDTVKVPTDFKLKLFNLGKHEFQNVPSYEVEEYIYNPEIEKKLILPEEHKDLIDILLSDEIKQLQGGDIIEGKGMGTMILTKGGPGLGKTVTAEVYSEKQKMPIYSVHSGQLGTKGEDIEKELQKVFRRAERWDCVLLIDEADVYIRKRDNDVNHNAIVATFLRTMEYYKGTMFMTTNRTDDVDEAIESRCTAVLVYELPQGEMLLKLWHLFKEQFNLNVSDDTIDKVSEKFGEISGRDIKNITMLVQKLSISKKMEEVDFKTYTTCGLFRGKLKV